MKEILFIINLVLTLYGSAPIFTTCEALPEDRQEQVYITIDKGIYLNEFGDGKLYRYGSEYTYISYRNVKNADPGDIIYTYCILNPDTNYFDDIICRIDIIEKSGEIFINMENITEYIVTEYGLQLYFDDGTGYFLEG